MYWYLFVIIPVNHHNQVINAVINFICKEWVLSIKRDCSATYWREGVGRKGGGGQRVGGCSRLKTTRGTRRVGWWG